MFMDFVFFFLLVRFVDKTNTGVTHWIFVLGFFFFPVTVINTIAKGKGLLLVFRLQSVIERSQSRNSRQEL